VGLPSFAILLAIGFCIDEMREKKKAGILQQQL
jgi:hypothetical protein